METMQLQVARGNKLCKAVRRIKDADPFMEESAGAGNGRTGDFYEPTTLDLLQSWSSFQRRIRRRSHAEQRAGPLQHRQER
jgi:hypothetical protein